MTTITTSPVAVSALLDARVAQANAAIDDLFVSGDASSLADWNEMGELKQELAGAMFAQQRHFVIQHHLAKTILSST